MAIVWIVLGLVLVAVELHHLAFFTMFGAAGSFAAAGVAAVAPSAYVLQIAVGVAVAAIGLVAVRPHISKSFASHGAGGTIRGVHGGLLGARGMTLDQVGVHHRGHVKILGETWLAVTGDSGPIEAATPVVVTEVIGTTLTVQSVQEQKEAS